MSELLAFLQIVTTPWTWFVLRPVRRQYLWRDSTLRSLGHRRDWHQNGKHKRIHQCVRAILSTLDPEYWDWKEATATNNTRLYRESPSAPHWTRHTFAPIANYIVDPSYSQFLELQMDRDIAQVRAEKKTINLKKWAEKDSRDRERYKAIYDSYIQSEFSVDADRYINVLHWGWMSGIEPRKAARLYDEKTVPFDINFNGSPGEAQSFDVKHIYQYLNEEFPADPT